MSEPMSSDVFPLPALRPLTQLNVQDDLRINAERWELAHQYHQQRQNIHYQALWQPGIVYGLGVRLIDPPPGRDPQFQSWIQVQPGFAIDGEGNPIVVGEQKDRTFPMTLPTLTPGIQTLYIVVRHVDPKYLELSNSTDRLEEQFRFDQRVNQLEPRDIELCRIRLSPEQQCLSMPERVSQPGLGQLDLNHRRFAKLRSQRSFTLGLLPRQAHYSRAINLLLQATQVLYRDLHGQLQLLPTIDVETLAGLDALCLEGTSLIAWHQSEEPQQSQLFQAIRAYGGNLIIVTDQLDQALQNALKRLRRNLDLKPIVPPHPITQRPFLFGQLPELTDGGTLWIDQRIIVLPSAIIQYWEGKAASRQDIRTWHELGINLLHDIWHNSHLRKLLA